MASGADIGQDGVTNAAGTTRLARLLDAAQQITHIGSWEWDLATGVVTWSDELYRIYGLAPRSCAITLGEFLTRVHPDDRERVQREVAAVVRAGVPSAMSNASFGRMVRCAGSTPSARCSSTPTVVRSR